MENRFSCRITATTAKQNPYVIYLSVRPDVAAIAILEDATMKGLTPLPFPQWSLKTLDFSSVERVEWEGCSAKRNAFPFRRKRRANDAIVGAVDTKNHSTVAVVAKANLEGVTWNGL
jgi:hypothetical protein